MSTDANKDLARAYFAAFLARDEAWWLSTASLFICAQPVRSEGVWQPAAGRRTRRLSALEL
jgi:hypothetical protein